jgi:uncharacterized protein YktB (UPF0637 family)
MKLNFTGFAAEDFDVFAVEGLEERMEALKAHLRVKLTQLGQDLAPVLTGLTGEPMYAHVAKHARRKTNPPRDSWVAWSKNPRGYKMFPHFQVGAWQTHAFVQFGIIYESPMKDVFAEQMMKHLEEIKRLVPGSYAWYPDHMNPVGRLHKEMSQEDFVRIAERLAKQKNGEVMVGMNVSREDAVRLAPEEFLRMAEEAFATLTPLYKLAFSVNE